MSRIFEGTIKLRRDTAANWAANNPTLADGEIGIATDDNSDWPVDMRWYIAKLGPGQWNTLPPFAFGDAGELATKLTAYAKNSEVSATPGANMIVKAGGDGTIDIGWLPALSYLDLDGLPTLGTVSPLDVDTDVTLAGNSNVKIPSQAAVKAFVENLIDGVSWKTSVAAATTGNITLSGIQNIDGVTGAAGLRILVKNNTDQTENGIWIMASGAWSRASDASTGMEVWVAAVYVRSGTTNGNRRYVNNNTTLPTIGVSNISFVLMDAANGYTADEVGITLSGNSFSLKSNGVTNSKLAQMAANSLKGNNTGSTANAADLTASQVRTLLSLVVGTDVLAYSTLLSNLAGITGAADKVAYLNGSNTWLTADFKTLGRAIVGMSTPAAAAWLRMNSDGTVTQQSLLDLANALGLYYATLASDFSKNSATPSNITDLALTLPANSKGRIHYRGQWNRHANASGITLGLSGPSGATAQFSGYFGVGGASPTLRMGDTISATMQQTYSNGTSADFAWEMWVDWTTGGTGGAMNLTIATTNSNANVIRAGAKARLYVDIA